MQQFVSGSMGTRVDITGRGGPYSPCFLCAKGMMVLSGLKCMSLYVCSQWVVQFSVFLMCVCVCECALCDCPVCVPAPLPLLHGFGCRLGKS